MGSTPRPKTTPLAWVALGVTLTLVAAAVVPPLLAARRSAAADEQRFLRMELEQVAAKATSPAALRRTPDGPLKAVDVAQLATWAATADDPAAFARLRALLLDHFLVLNEDDPFTHGMVAWAWTPGQPLDASGTTEALRTAEALLAGLDAEHPASEPGDAETAHLILRAYARHATTEGGLWYVRNYLNLQTRAFATNSFLIDFDPDLLAAAGERFHDDVLKETAERSADLIRRCLTPAGLLHQMIRPEVATAMGPGYVIYSANGHEQLSLSLSVAERCVDTAPEVARTVLGFTVHALDEHGTLHQRYRFDTGEPVGDAGAGLETWSPFVRVAAKLGDRAAFDAALPGFLEQARWFADRQLDPAAERPPERVYILGETLLALRAASAFPPE